MKIILTAAVSKLGKIGEIVTVKNGYAKNFLIPSGKAISFSGNNAKIFEAKRKDFEAANEKELAAANEVKAKIAKKNVVVIEKASDDGRLYGSVNSVVIASAINEVIKDEVALRSNVVLEKPIKEIGVYNVGLALHSDVQIDVRLVVARSDSEVVGLIKAEQKEKAAASEAKKAEANQAKKSEEKKEEKSEETTEEVKEEAEKEV